MSDIFISYKQDDRARVQLLADALEAKGWDVWWDPEIRFGDNYRAVIGEALDSARAVVVAWSHSSVKSSWVLDEAERGLQRAVLFPVKIEEGIKTPLGFGGTQTADLSAWMKDQTQTAAFERLCDAIAAKIGPPNAPAPGANAGAGAQSPVVVPLVKRPARWSLAGRPAWQLVSAVVLGLAALTAVLIYARQRVGPAPANPGVAASPSPSAEPAGTGKVNPVGTGKVDPVGTGKATPADEEAAAGPLKDLRCVLPGEAKNPILERAAGAVPLLYTVDTTRHLLLNKEGQPVTIVAAADLGGQLEDRRLIVAHFTAAPPMTAEKYFEQGGISKASVHVLIARDGTVKQLVTFDFAANHVGTGSWNGLSNLNHHSIGIDLENAGTLTRGGDGWQAFGRRVPDEEVALVGESKAGWQKYTDAQIRAFFQVACALRRAYPTIEDVAGHDQVSPLRKTDPGPAFPMEEMRRSLFPAKRSDTGQ